MPTKRKKERGDKNPDSKRGKNPKSLANLKPIQPGEVRNPTGINRGRIYSDAYENTGRSSCPIRLRKLLIKELGKEAVPEDITWAQGISLKMHLKAIKDGDASSAKEVRESVEGKARQRMEVTGADGKDLIPTSGIDALSDSELEERWKKMEAVVRASRDKDWNE